MHRTTSPDTSDAGIEHELVAKGKTAPRVTRDAIEDEIASEFYFRVRKMTRAEFEQMFPPSG